MQRYLQEWQHNREWSTSMLWMYCLREHGYLYRLQKQEGKDKRNEKILQTLHNHTKASVPPQQWFCDADTWHFLVVKMVRM